MAHKIVKMKASELVEDFSIYPRNSVFDGHVYDIREAIRSGAAFPPIVACDKTSRITDGFHRRRANVLEFGPDVELDVMLVAYASDGDMALDAMTRNAVHGRRMTTADFARCAALAKKFRISRERLSGALHLTREKLDEIVATRFATGSEGPVVLRRSQVHLAGRKLTKAQEAVCEKVGGQTAIAHVNVLIDLIESKSLPDDDRLVERLQKLHGLLEGLLVT